MKSEYIGYAAITILILAILIWVGYCISNIFYWYDKDMLKALFWLLLSNLGTAGRCCSRK